ncbi:MAG: SDR family NAD(P)-dependent oxidoreductase [Spirochaetaceae bacterium]
MNWYRSKRIWITGASSGLGRALAIGAAALGARPILSGRDEGRLEEVGAACREVGGEAELLPFDICDSEGRRRGIEAVSRDRLDGLINNAGVSQRSLVAGTGLEVYRQLFETNLMSAIDLTLGTLPLIRRSGDGRIVAISSIAGELYGPQRSGYGASKAGMNAFFYSLRSEVAPEGIGVTVVIPGFIRTEVSRNALTGEGERYGRMDSIQERGMDPTAAARRILADVAAGKRCCRVAMAPKLRFGLFMRTLVPSLYDRAMRSARVT